MAFQFNLLDGLARINGIRKRKEERAARDRAARDRAVNVDDLVARFHQVGKVRLPYPTLMAKRRIELHFGDWDKIDLSDDLHLAAMVYYLENGNNPEISNLSPEAVEDQINAIMCRIGLDALPEYQECILQIMMAIKKKSIRYQLSFLNRLREQLRQQAPADGPKA